MLRRILKSLGYLSLTILLVGFTIALVAYGNDYTYDFSSHKIIQKGHVIIDSLPNGIKITADGHALTKKTPYQAAYKVGLHTFGLTKDGFWPWQKTLQVIAGQVTLADYVVLVPKSPVTTVLDTKTQIIAQTMSRDHRHLAYITSGTDAAVYTLDLGNPKPVRLYVPKVATATTPAEVITGVAWSDDASHLLITGTAGAAAVQLLESASGGAPTNLTTQYGFDFTGIKFSSSDWKQLYWISPDGLRRLDVGAQSVSAVLADKVTQFWTIPDRVLYVQEADLGRSLWSVDRSGHQKELIQALPVSPTYSVAYESFRGDDQLAVVPSATQIGTIYTGVFGDTPTAKTIAHSVLSASFSPDGHLLAFYSPTLIVTYDLDRSGLENKLVSYDITQPVPLSTVSWFDSYHLLTTRGSELFWSEYDGTNQVDLGPIVAGSPAYGTSDAKSLIEFQSSGVAVHINRVQIKP